LGFSQNAQQKSIKKYPVSFWVKDVLNLFIYANIIPTMNAIVMLVFSAYIDIMACQISNRFRLMFSFAIRISQFYHQKFIIKYIISVPDEKAKSDMGTDET
jgi:hypothetical protein